MNDLLIPQPMVVVVCNSIQEEIVLDRSSLNIQWVWVNLQPANNNKEQQHAAGSRTLRNIPSSITLSSGVMCFKNSLVATCKVKETGVTLR